MRLFIAVNLASHLRHGIWDAARPLRAADYPIKWVAPDGLHVTLKFLGAVPPERERDIVAGLERVVDGARAFPLVVTGFGAFPSLARPRVLWAGCDPTPPLELLQHRVEQEMDRLGFPPEGRAFHPHVTIGRVRRGASPRDLAALAADVEPLGYEAETTVGSVDLMESVLSRAGARYQLRHAAVLAQ